LTNLSLGITIIPSTIVVVRICNFISGLSSFGLREKHEVAVVCLFAEKEVLIRKRKKLK